MCSSDLGAVLGHNFPFYLKFKGGKGVACTGGMVLAVFPIVAPVSMGLFLVISAVTKYVSLGSIIGLISVFVQVVVYGQLGIITVPTGIRAEFYIVTACFTILGVWQHRANIRRLANGTEKTRQAVTADEAGNWTYTFKDLPKYANGKEITYTVTEEAVEGYETSVDGFNITNTYTTETTEVKGSKTWNDADNQDGKRPRELKVKLYRKTSAEAEPEMPPKK